MIDAKEIAHEFLIDYLDQEIEFLDVTEFVDGNYEGVPEEFYSEVRGHAQQALIELAGYL